jgi:hypothetical protein
VAEEIEREKRRAEKGMKTHAEKLAEMEAEMYDEEEEDIKRRCVKLWYEDGQLHLNATLAQDEPFLEDDGTNHVKGIVHDCAMAFENFRKEHPDVTEMHFYTDDELAMNNEES